MTRLARLLNDGDELFGCTCDVHGIARLQLGFGNQFGTDSKRGRTGRDKGGSGIKTDAAGWNQRNVGKRTAQSLDVFRSANITARKNFSKSAPRVHAFTISVGVSPPAIINLAA